MVTTSDFRELSKGGTVVVEGSQRYDITIPHIVNDKKIRTGEKIVLKWHKDDDDKKGIDQKPPRTVTAFDRLMPDAKRQKAN